MVLCTIREIKQLDQLRQKLDLELECADARTDKTHTLIGYCQGLFNHDGLSPKQHTAQVAKYLEEISAPFPKSHELFIGLKPEEMSLSTYVTEAISPLSFDGRVPIIITEYDPKRDKKTIEELLATKPPVANNHTVLVRMNLSSPESIPNLSNIISQLYNNCRERKEMPTYWPLLQANSFGSKEWEMLRGAVGEEVWKYVTIAVTPFTAAKVSDVILDNIAVYQFLVGRVEGVHSNGDIEFSGNGCVDNENKSGTKDNCYNVIEYAHLLRKKNLGAQVGIVCGQSQGWTQDENCERVRRYVPLLREAAKILWGREI